MVNSNDFAQLIDHTLIKPDVGYQQIENLCKDALEFGFASVCVQPFHVARCAAALKGSPVRVCSVVGFPQGATLTVVKTYEALQVISRGASEVDMVINVGALKANDLQAAQEDIAAVVEACHSRDVICKVIIETVLLSDPEKMNACRLAQAAGADFVKTSTGFNGGGATIADVQLMRQTVGSKMGVKAAGGIRTLEQAQAMIAAGASRIGTSSSVSIMRELAQTLR